MPRFVGLCPTLMPNGLSALTARGDARPPFIDGLSALRPNRRAFTIIELLVILAVLGVMVAIVSPMIAGGTDVSRVRTATRGVMRMSRYARTMAVLHGSQMELVFSTNGKLCVEKVSGGGGGESIVSARAFATTNAVADAETARMAAFDAEPQDSGSGGGSYTMADVNTEQTYEQVQFVFEGYTDTADAGRFSHLLSPEKTTDPLSDGTDEDEDSVRTVRVRYKSNGTCRPYKVKITTEGDDAFSLTVAVDMLGVAKVLEDEEK
ncbi:MAG: prepilin-type N-terminal cleavage/methylation domain-containing protein [Kiritimatiellaeota bacterium]|nr:prepilin-type N-terminal cleavage/methylation domain-containing protein [Kiritimatiellota bacterium]